MNVAKIEALAKTPRVIDDNLIKIQGKPLFLLKKAIRSWEQALTNGPLVFGFVVQANEVLFEPGEGARAPAVLMYTEDPALSRDVGWLTQLGTRIAALKTSGTEDPEANMLGALLAAETSDFDRQVPLSLTGGVPVRIYTTILCGDKLQSGCVGQDRIVPLLVMDKDDAREIPAELYT